MHQPSERANIVTRRTYNRPLNEEGTVFETYEETVDRVIRHQRWLWERAKGEALGLFEEAELGEFKEAMLERILEPSGRTLWLGGTEVAKTREASQFNPLPADTQFITSKGVTTFENLAHGDVVEVPTHKGRWKSAKVSSMGARKVLELTLSRGRSVQKVKTSDDHNWLLSDGTRVQAKDLLPGQDKLVGTPDLGFYTFDFWESSTEEQLYWLYGFVFGDGSIARSGNSVTSRVRLCGNKATHLDKFKAFGFEFSFPPTCGGDPFVYTGTYLKSLPAEGTDMSLIRAFLHGYFSADANKVSRHGREVFSGISTKDTQAAKFIRKYAPAVGLYILQDQEVVRNTNYGTFAGTEFSFFTSTGSLLWALEGVKEVGEEECWCLTVDTDASFILANGVVTGNCSFGRVETVHDAVDADWLLLQGCGVGFEPVRGVLNGFAQPVKVETIRSKRSKDDRGNEKNQESFYDEFDTATLKTYKVWHLKVGDSAEAWAKSLGKILAMKRPVDIVRLDYSEIRGGGKRLKGYGWISSGDETLHVAYEKICKLLSDRAGQLLSRMDIHDILNLIGTTLSSRRSAEISMIPVDDPEIDEFILAKKDWWLHDNAHRQQSNNSVVFHSKPSKWELAYIFDRMVDAGGSEPGFINAETAKRRAPWFKGSNPCVEILLGNKSFCNLVEVDWGKLVTLTLEQQKRYIWLAGRANYRQTCVNLDDGILQRSWHELNEFLRLCGVGATGIVKFFDKFVGDLKGRLQAFREAAQFGANSMADELGLPRPKLVTTIKPSGTLSKIMDTTEGIHRPLGRYIFNNVTFSKYDPIVDQLRAANYKIWEKPFEAESVLVRLPVDYSDVEFTKVMTPDGRELEVNTETAIDQLERYKLVMENYVDHNCSITVSYDVEEIPAIVDWILQNWETYVGVSFIYRNDPTKTAEDLGYAYLPQEVVTKEAYNDYVKDLLFVDLDAGNSFAEMQDEGCATGACPIR